MSQSITVFSTAIRQFDGLYSLNDLHRVSGSEVKNKPAFFLRLEQTRNLVEELRVADVQLIPIKIIKGRGKAQGTYVCRELVIAYGAWISAKIHLAVIQAFLRQQDEATQSCRNTPVENAVGILLKLNSKAGAQMPDEFKRQIVDFIRRNWPECLPVDDGRARTASALAIGSGLKSAITAAVREAVALSNTARLPDRQAKEIMERLDRLAGLFHPFSSQFADAMGVIRALRGLDPRMGIAEPSFVQLLGGNASV